MILWDITGMITSTSTACPTCVVKYIKLCYN
jgi:hypothetical protein